MSSSRGTISASALKDRVKAWICGSPFMRQTLTNQFAVGAIILGLIMLIDAFHGKGFEVDTPAKEVVQYVVFTWGIVTASIFMNNLALNTCNKIGGGNELESHHEPRHEPSACSEPDRYEWTQTNNKYDDVLSTYK